MSAGSLARSVGCAIRGGSRLATFRSASPADFEPSAGVFAALVAIDMLLMFAFCLVAFGLRGELNIYEIPRALMFVPMVLAAGMTARRLSPGTDLLLLPVAFAAASIVVTIVTSLLYI